MRNAIAVAAALIFCLGVSEFTQEAAQARPFTAKDMATLDRVADPQISPDGRLVLFDLRTVDFDANKSAHALWIADSSGKTPARRLAASDGGATNGRWSKDGRAIYFLSSRKDGVAQVFRTDVSGEKAIQITNMPFDVEAFRVAPDNKTILVSQAVYPDCADLGCNKAKADAKQSRKANGVVYDRLFVRHWDSWADGTRNHLFAVSLDASGIASGKPLDLMSGFDADTPTKPYGDEEDFVISPDSKSVIFVARIKGRDESWSTNFDLYQGALDGSMKPRNLTASNKAADLGPVYSPDGKTLAYRAMKRPGFEADRNAVMIRDIASGKEHELAPDWDRSAAAIKWSADGKTLFVEAEDVGQTKLFAFDVKSGKGNAVTGNGHVSAFDVGPSGLVFALDDMNHPAQLFATDLKGEGKVALTQVNEAVLSDIQWGEAEQFSFPGWNNETVHGYVVKPSGFEAGKSYPVAFLIHGGPQGSFGNLFHYRWNAQTYAGAGYAVVMIDFHGSTGYGQAFTDAISRHWGDRPLEDLQKGWAYALSHYKFLDGDHACALGGSYGGFMVNWIAGQWNQPWKCLVNHDGIFDNRFMAYSTEELWFSEWENGGTPWEKDTDYSKFNPADHVANWVKPMLVVHGAKDFRVPLEEGIGTFTALQRKGVPSKFLYFPDENHWVLKPQNSVQWHEEVLSWLNQWTGK